jgi:hypothetical protein
MSYFLFMPPSTILFMITVMSMVTIVSMIRIIMLILVVRIMERKREREIHVGRPIVIGII